MSGDGDKLLSFIKDVRRFCEQAAGILNTADNELARHGWETAMAQNIAFAGTSSTLSAPRLWFPTELFRFYKKQGALNRVAFVSLLLSDDPEGSYALEEPQASCGVLYMTEDLEPTYVVKSYWWARFHGYMKSSGQAGSIYSSLRPREVWPDHVAKDPEWYPFHLVNTFAIPLAECTSEAVVRERVLRPLLEMLAE